MWRGRGREREKGHMDEESKFTVRGLGMGMTEYVCGL